MTPSRTKSQKAAKGSAKKVSPKPREAVLEDFRRVAGPLRGQNRDQKPKA